MEQLKKNQDLNLFRVPGLPKQFPLKTFPYLRLRTRTLLFSLA